MIASPRPSSAAVRRDIAALLRDLPREHLLELIDPAALLALPDDLLLALAGERVEALVAKRAAAKARDEPPAAPRRAPPRKRIARARCEATPAPVKHPRGALLPWPRSAPDGTPLGVDLAAKGKQHATIACDVRHLVLARLVGQAATLDADDLLQDVYLRIARRNVRPSAFDRRRASLSKYVYRLTSGAIADALGKASRSREVLSVDPEALPVGAEDADPRSLDAVHAIEDADTARAVESAVADPALEAAAILGPVATAVPLWRLALRSRAVERAQQRTVPAWQLALRAAWDEDAALVGDASPAPRARA